MALPIPNLDDRTFADLVAEALALIPGVAPEWTNHNPSDPGITIVELLAFLTESLIYRINRISDAQKIAFLRLLNGAPGGVAWAPAPGVALEDQIRTTVLALRRIDRAVTEADFEQLALAADPRVARARCVARRNLDAPPPGSPPLSSPPGSPPASMAASPPASPPASMAASPPASPPASMAASPPASPPSGPGPNDPDAVSVSVVVVPDRTVTDPNQLNAVLDNVRRYLDERRLVATRLHVVGPRYVAIGVNLTVQLVDDALPSALGARILAALERFFDPLQGGPDGRGWPFGRHIFVSEVYRVVETVQGVDFVARTTGQPTPPDEVAAIASPASRRVPVGTGNLVEIVLDAEELVQLDPANISLILVTTKGDRVPITGKV